MTPVERIASRSTLFDVSRIVILIDKIGMTQTKRVVRRLEKAKTKGMSEKDLAVLAKRYVSEEMLRAPHGSVG